MKTTLSLSLALLLGCHPSTPPVPKEVISTPTTAATTTPEALPAGVLAQGRGLSGLVQVSEREGLRLLTIDGVVQGAQPLVGNTLQADPMVELLLGIRPAAKTALLIGLGTGQTAAQLTAKGITVTTIEIEPLVAEYAKQFFGFTGAVIVADGLAYLKQNETKYDLVLMDATTGKKPPAALMTKEAVALMQRSCAEDGVIAARLLARPDAPEIQDYIKRFGSRHYAGLGSGLAQEEQNLYIFGSREPLEIYPPKGLMVRPVSLPNYEVTASAKVSLVGYLVRLSEDGSLALDLPHAEMGALRFLLTGPEVAALEKLLPAKASFPTTGDISSDGDTSKTLQGLLGGGGVKRSDVRFSSVLVALEGSAQFRAAVDAERAFAGKMLSRGGPGAEKLKEPLLPYGGVLYELSVERVLNSYDAVSWQKLTKQLAPSAEKSIKALKKGDLASAEGALQEYQAGLQAALGPLAERVAFAQHLSALLTALREARAALDPKPTPLAQAVACDRVSEGTRDGLYWSSDEYRRLQDGLSLCAIFWYEKVAAKGSDDELARQAAGRLLGLYSMQNNEKGVQAINKRFGEPTILYEPLTLPQ